MLRSILHWSKNVAVLIAGLFLLYALTLGDDLRNSLRSPQTMRGVRRLVLLEDSASRGSYDRVVETLPAWKGMSTTDTWHALENASRKAESGDFDGDDVPDRLEVEYYHQEPLFSRSTSGMVMIVSGATGRTLLGSAVDCPMNPVTWCGDLDGNGTDDVLVVQNGSAVVLGSEGVASKR